MRPDLLSRVQPLSWNDRMIAYEDFDAAINHRQLARWNLRTKPLGWAGEFQTEIRKAIRAWKHFKNAVRKAEARRAA